MASVGMNLESVDYFSTEHPFIDRMKTSSPWMATLGTLPNGQTIALDANGYPAGMPNGVTQISTDIDLDRPSAGTSNIYEITWSGTADISLLGAKILSSAPGKIVVEYDLESDWSRLDVRDLSTSDPLTSIHVVRQDQVSLFNQGEIFNPAFLNEVSNWSDLRFKDWNHIDSGIAGAANQLNTAQSASWSNGNGVPISVEVALANKTHNNMWINIPTDADDTYVRSTLQYVHDHLDPGLTVKVEYSNEVWNWSYAQSHYALTAGTPMFGADNGGWVKYYGYRSAQVAAIADQVFKDAPGRVSPVLETQTAYHGLEDYIFQGIAAAHVGSTSSLFGSYAVTTYFGTELATGTAADQATVLAWARGGSAGMDAAFHELEFGGGLTFGGSLADLVTDLEYQSKVASDQGLKMVAYEGGVALSADSYASDVKGEVSAFFQRLVDDPRMGQLYTKMAGIFYAAGGTELDVYNDTSAGGTWGDWGLLNSVYQTSSPRYDAMVAVSRAAKAAAGNQASGAAIVTPASSTTTVNPTQTTVTTSQPDASAATSQISATASSTTAASTTTTGQASGTATAGSSSSSTAISQAGASIATAQTATAPVSDTASGSATSNPVAATTTPSQSASATSTTPSSTTTTPSQPSTSSGPVSTSSANGSASIAGPASTTVTAAVAAAQNVIHGTTGHDVLAGSAGDDLIYPGGGGDTVDGGAGSDTLVMSGKASAWTTYAINGSYFLTSGASSIKVSNIETVAFADATVAWSTLQTAARAFDGLAYIAANPDLIHAFGANAAAGVQHFLTYGYTEGRPTSFDGLEYIASNPDLIMAFGANAGAGETHYIQLGNAEHRATSTFDPLRYIASYGDLIKAFGKNTAAATAHYDAMGYREGRTITFDALAYTAASADLARAFGTDQVAAEHHYIDYGYAENRATSGFDSVAYLLSNPDLGRAGLDAQSAFTHWLTYGAKEGRSGDALYGRDQASHLLDVSHNASDMIGSAGDHDWFEADLVQGQHYSFTVKASGFAAELALSDSQGLAAAHTTTHTNADGSVTLDVYAAQTGAFYLTVDSLAGLGAYSVAESHLSF